jgi:two-component system, OmpR family, phosphate regulon sensor histidine kinase PhoR
MVHYIRDEPGLLAFPIVESVLPDNPPQTEALAGRAIQRLYLRRWLVAVCGLVILGFVLLYGLPALPAAAGFAAFAATAAWVPREGLFSAVRLAPRASHRADLTQLFAALLDGLPAPAILLTARGEIWGFNSLAKELLSGLRAGQHISTAIRDPHLLDALSGAAQALERQTIVIEERVPIARHLEATLSFIAKGGQAANRAPAILLFLRDLTEQERLNRLRSDFIANASHELRTPLASVLGFIETLQGAAKNDPNAQQRFLSIMARQAERMARLIDDLLSLSRVEMRQHLRPQARCDLDELLRHVVATMEPIAAASAITLHFEGLRGPAIVLGDRDELAQVLSNLIHNAIKYGRSGGNVCLSLSRASDPEDGGGGRFAIAVRDDGAGIAAEHLPRLTERFYRAGGNGGEASGTGLGLAIVKHAVARHRGELRIESAPGEGSTFTVLLQEAPATTF